MKTKIYSLIAGLLLTASVWAQAPQKMSYQAVIRNSSNTLVTSTSVGMQISILQGTPTGTVAYSETQTLSTNANGLVSLEIGTGTPVTGTFASINWATGPYFIKTETDPTGGTNYTIAGTNELMSVPYALFSANGTPGATGAQGPIGLTGAQGIAGNNGTDGTNGTNGTNGLSAYDVWIGLGNVGTQTDFINSLTGPQGTIGLPGTNGAVGATGPAGAAGVDGTNGTNGIDGVNGAVGATGPAGAAGVDGTNGTNGIDGADGADGAAGPQGNQGLPGTNGATGATGAAGQGGFTQAGLGILVIGTGTSIDPYILSSKIYTIGLWPELGGYVFRISADGRHGLVAETQNQSLSSLWNDAEDNISNPANHSANGQKFMDWRLPTRYELNEMYSQKVAIGGFSIYQYWSSTVHSSGSAVYVQTFGTGSQNSYPQSNTYNVRAVRAF